MSRQGRFEWLLLQSLSFWPCWVWYFSRMTDGSDEPWGVLALCSVVFVVVRSPWDPQERPAWIWLGMFFMLSYILAYYFLPQLVCAVLAMASMYSVMVGLGLCRGLRFSCLGLMLLSLPIIASLQFYLGFPIRWLTAHIVAIALSITGLEVFVQGTALFLNATTVVVDAPCAGVKMLWSGLYFNFLLSSLLLLPPKQAWCAYLASSLFIFVGNVGRALVLSLIESDLLRTSMDVHDLVGILVFTIIASAILKLNLILSKATI